MAEAAPSDGDAPSREKAHHRGKGHKLDRLCEKLACTDEQRVRMRSLRALVADFNVYRWAGRMLMDAARLRQRERIAARIERQSARARRAA